MAYFFYCLLGKNHRGCPLERSCHFLEFGSFLFLCYVIFFNYSSGSAVKNLPSVQETQRDLGSFPGSGRSPGGGHGNPLEYSCLENPMNRRAWWATVREVIKSRTQLSVHVETEFSCRFLHPNQVYLSFHLSMPDFLFFKIRF